MIEIGVVTDDFTGAASSGMMMAKYNVETILLYDRNMLDSITDFSDTDAIYISSNSRNMSPKDAFHAVSETTKQLLKLSPKFLSKKIDTTLRGKIGVEIDAMLSLMPKDTVAIFVSSMPQSKRICVGGYSIIDNVILTETPIAQDVKAPVNESHIPTLIDSQSNNKVGFIDLNYVLEGEEILKEKLKQEKNQGNKIIILDAISLEHIDLIAKTCIGLEWNVLSVDPGPLTVAFAKYNKVTNEIKPPKDVDSIEISQDKTALIISGSANPETCKQLNYLKNEMNCKRVTINVLNLLENPESSKGEVIRVINESVSIVENSSLPEALIIDTLQENTRLDLKTEDKKRGFSNNMSSTLINQGIAEITSGILERVDIKKIAGLLLTGGDTMEAVSRKIGVLSIKADDSIVAQIDVGRIIGRYNNLPVIVKGGFCGSEDIFVDIVKRLHFESK